MSNSIKQNYSFDGGAAVVGTRGIIPGAQRLERTIRGAAFVKPQIKFLLKNRILSELSDDVFVRLLPFMESVSLGKNEAIYQSGDEIGYVYFPESALISEFQILEDGRTIEIALIGADGGAGIVQAVNSQPTTTWAHVCLAGAATRIDAKIFRREVRQSLSLYDSLFGYMNGYLSQIVQRVVCHRYHLVEERFCTWLLTLNDHKKHGELPITQEEVARLLGVHRPSITRIAQSLRDVRAIDYLRGKIVILDRRRLKELACSCYAEKNKNRRGDKRIVD